ncbi:Ribosomal protein L35Ae domain containing protein [Aphelenchoides bicaudatus]|nr:Ribosomal protein L35Ae domain containing protein [Aphelenchoides bicaudatus]
MSEATATARPQTHARRLYVRAIFTGFKRGQRIQHENTSLLKLEGVYNKEDAKFYLGKRVVYVYKAHKKIAKGGHEKTRVRAIWGRVTRVHGNSGSVRAKVPSQHASVGYGKAKRVRVMMYPSNI